MKKRHSKTAKASRQCTLEPESARRAEEDSRGAHGSAADAALIQLVKLIGDLAAEKNKAWEIAIYNQQIVEMIPMGLPDGTGIMGPVSWVAWAKQKLGYGEL